MAESIERFRVSEKGFSLPVREVLTGRGFVTGKSGSGKSNTASVVAEELLDRGLGLLIIDTDGEYSALKERYELLQVGGDDQCDREITAEDAPLIADLALEENVPIILDVSGYMDEEVADDVIHAVVRELFVAEKQHQKPFLLFVEEAHEFIPERGGGDDVHKMLVRVAKRGRKRGLGVVAMSQRPAAVAKDYITQCDWLVWHRLTWENDTKVAGRVLGGDAAESVQSLDDGEALVMTDWDEKLSRVQFRRKKTVDQGSTPDLKEAYGPPSAREDHVTQSVDEESTDGDDATEDESVEDGAADAGGRTETSAAGGVDEQPASPSASSPTDEGQDTGTESTSEGTAHSRTSNWDLSDVDIEPRNPEPGDRATSKSEPTERSPQTDASQLGQRKSAADQPSSTGEPTPAGSSTTASRQRRRITLEEPDEYDPVWEIAQLIVYGYVVVSSAHRRAYHRIRASVIAVLSGVHNRTRDSQNVTEPGRVERFLASLFAISVLVGAYSLTLALVAVLLVG